MRTLIAAAGAALLAACATASAETAPAPVHAAGANVVAGPLASPELVAAITERDRQLFDIAFNTCNVDALRPLLADEFSFIHDKGGTTASDPDTFVADVREMCAGRLTGQNVMASRVLVPDSLRIYAVQDNAAIEIGTHLFYGLEPGHEPVLRESGQFFHYWRLVDGEWRLAQVFSYDHRPAE